MSVRIRMKKMGRTHRPFFRICAIDKRSPRDGRVLEELGTYDPSISDTNARAILKLDRIDYWLSVGAQPSGNVSVLIKKYGTAGTHVDVQKAALEKIALPRIIPDPGEPASMPKSPEPETSEEKTESTPTAEAESPAKDSTEDSTTAEPAKETATGETATDETPTAETAESDSGDSKETDTAKSS